MCIRDRPIEAGLAISDNIVRITQKHRDGDWEVKGYKYRSGILMQVDLFQLERQGSLSRESYRNMQTLESTEQYSVPETNEFAFRNYYSTLPCYSRGRNLNTGYQTSSKIVSSKNIIKGGFNWKNMFDCSFSNRSVSYTHLRAHETVLDLVCRLLLEKKKNRICYQQSSSSHKTNIT